MDLARANILIDTLLNTANDLQNLAVEERDPIVSEWLQQFAKVVGIKAVQVAALPMQDPHPRKTATGEDEPGFVMKEHLNGIYGKYGEPLPPEIPHGMSVSNQADGYSGH